MPTFVISLSRKEEHEAPLQDTTGQPNLLWLASYVAEATDKWAAMAQASKLFGKGYKIRMSALAH
ncbi:MULTISPECIES: hypothetical protein [Halomonas]|uniref:hypothetical protein n=1 Tax=Halomonas TaxID=2745 RepID=UPI003CFBB5E7